MPQVGENSIKRTWKDTQGSKGEIYISGCDPSYSSNHLGMVNFGALVIVPVVRITLR